MTSVADVPALTGRDYFFAPKGRSFPHHGFSSRAIIGKRFAESTTPLLLSVSVVIPTMMRTHGKLDEYVDEGVDMPLRNVLGIMVDSGKHELLGFADYLARVAARTGFACLLIRSKTAYGDSVVYLWDVYPKMHQYYIAEVVRLLRLPRFFAGLLGPCPTESEVEVYNAPITPVAAAEDCLKRSVLQMVSDVVVDAAECTVVRVLDRKSEMQSSGFLVRSAIHVTVCILGVCGSAVGRAAANVRGEYWGEIVGTSMAPLVVAKLLVSVHKSRRHRRSGSGRPTERTRSSSAGGGRKEGSSHRGSGRRSISEKTSDEAH